MSFRIVIPARYASVRLPGKPLRRLAGRPLIEHVYRRAAASGAAEIVVATDDERVAEVCRSFGAAVCMTAASHGCGTDRIAEVAARRGWDDEEVIVNLQGDEPLMPAAVIDQVAALLEADAAAGMATLAVPLRSLEEFLDPNVVKAVHDEAGRALYFSRAPIPWQRDGAPQGFASQSRYDGALRHIGLYAYRVEVLRRLAAAPVNALEIAERLEQLRALGLGIPIRIDLAVELPGRGVDTPEDLAVVAAILRQASAPR